MQVEPYLFFEGRCEEALEFYKRTVGAEVLFLMRFKESPDQSKTPPGMGEKVMHATVRIGASTLMASDGHAEGQPRFAGFALTISVKEVAEAERIFKALGEGGKVTMPLTETFYSPRFGMLTDRFGMMWMVMAEPKEQHA